MAKETKKENSFKFVTETEREVAVCIAIQKLGKASVQEIYDKIESWNGKLTEKQIEKCAENLRARDLFSIDLSEKDKHGISIKRYLMKKIKLAIPEIAQIKDIVDDPSIIPLKDELDRCKKTRKKGLKSFDYYKVEVLFEVEGEIQGFVPDEKGVLVHYRKGKEIVLYQYHFKNWLRTNLPLINRASSSIGDIRFYEGKIDLNNCKTKICEKFVTNVESGFNSSRGTGGRGTRKAECLTKGMKIITQFSFPRELISPEKIQKAFEVICENATSFGGNHKLSTGRLVNPKVEILEQAIWIDD